MREADISETSWHFHTAFAAGNPKPDPRCMVSAKRNKRVLAMFIQIVEAAFSGADDVDSTEPTLWQNGDTSSCLVAIFG